MAAVFELVDEDAIAVIAAAAAAPWIELLDAANWAILSIQRPSLTLRIYVDGQKDKEQTGCFCIDI